MKKTVLLFAAFVCFLIPQIMFAQLITGLDGSGSETDPVLIKSAQDLRTFSEYINAGKVNLNKFFKVINDIDFNNEAFEYDLDGDGEKESNFRPIGDNLERAFVGFFDGNNHTISGIKIKSNAGFIGLFGASIGSSGNSRNEVKNIQLKESTFEGVSIGNNRYMGGIVAYGQWCNIVNCSSTISMFSTVNYTIVGGIISYNYQNSIANCFSLCTITSSGQGSSVGGFIAAGGQNGLIKNSYSKCNITVNGDSCYVGGFAGSTHTPITNCYTSGTLSVTGKGSIVGGFIGALSTGGDISNCYSVTKITTNSDNTNGGFASEQMAGTVSNSYYINTWNDQELTNNTLGVAKTETEMKDENFVTLLNTNAVSAVWSFDNENKNGGFPVFDVSKVGLKPVESKNKIELECCGNRIKINGENLQVYKVFNIQGIQIEQKRISGNSCQFELEQPTGIYIVTVQSATNTVSSKIRIIR